MPRLCNTHSQELIMGLARIKRWYVLDKRLWEILRLLPCTRRFRAP